MSYALTGIESWARGTAETDEVYLWRAKFSGAKLRNIEDVQAIAAAIGKGQNLGMDLRGIAVGSSGDSYQIDAAFTTKVPRVYFADPTMDTASDIARKVRAELASRFPKLSVTDARFEVINDDDPRHPALDFWRSHAVIYEAQFLGSMVPTAAWERFEGLYRGQAEQGLALKAWAADVPFIDPPPVDGPSVATVALVVGGVALAGYLLYQQAQK